jgi:hypothetical protein
VRSEAEQLQAAEGAAIAGCYYGAIYGALYGIGVGIALTISWLRLHSLLWAALHGLLSWLYVGYRFLNG